MKLILDMDSLLLEIIKPQYMIISQKKESLLHQEET